jgi:AraC-like DNA-binding protein
MLHTLADSRAPEATIRCGALDGLDTLLESRGASLATACAAAGVDSRLLDAPEARLPVRHYVELLEAAARISGDDTLGLHLGWAQTPASLGMLGEATVRAPDLAAAVACYSRYLYLHQEGARLELLVDGRKAVVAYSIRDAEILDYRQDAEMSIAKMMRFARLISGRPALTPAAVYFEHPEPRDTSEHRRLFGAPVYFSQPYNALVVPCELLSARNVGADGEPLSLLQRHAQARQPEHCADGDLMAEVRRQILRGLRCGDVSIETIAAAMSLSERTLQRRLGEHGESFNELVSRLRFELSQRYLRHDHLSLTEIGYLLGYSELSAFSRAFRRWAGVSPIEFRRVACS